ncbi:MAG: EamA-like transporter family [Proteobacteria bacterium]|nr:EamA-like transporter family [Pseudomonadota bacterium]
MEGWILTSFLAALLSSAEKIAHRYNMIKIDDIFSYTIIFQILCAAISLPIAALNPVLPSPNEYLSYGWLILAAVCWAGFSLLTFHADKLLQASIKAGISRLRIIWAAIIGWLFFNESFSSVHIIGIVLIWFSPFVVARINGKGSSRGFIFEIAASIMIALALTFDKISAQYFDESVIVFFSFFNSAIIIFIIKNRQLNFSWPILRLAMPVSIISVICYLLLVYSLKHGEISLVISIYMTSPVLVTLMAIKILKESENILYKIISVCFAALGCILTMY